MKNLLLLLTVFLLLGSSAAAVDKVVEGAAACKQCGMSRSTFAHSRMVVSYANGEKTALCSLHCTAVELASAVNQVPVGLQVADYDSKELLDAELAVWVLGGSKKGVMTSQPKWAFATRSAAERFVKKHGGRIASYDEAIKAAFLDLYEETKVNRQFRDSRKAEAAGADAGHGPRGSHSH